MQTTTESPLAYLRHQMAGFGPFIPEYKVLSEADKLTLAAWATEEMIALGMVPPENPVP